MNLDFLIRYIDFQIRKDGGMMNKSNVLTQLGKNGVVAVLRAKNQEEAVKMTKHLIEGGVKAIEVTFTVPNADEVIANLVQQYDQDSEVVIGAGTVLDSMTARIAIMAGAKFIVSPSFDKDIAKICNLYQVPYMAGCMTITEMTEAMKYGVEVIKVFPASVYGPSFIKAIKAPLPQANIMPTGGVNLDNLKEWLTNGAVAVGVGGNLVTLDDEGYEGITRRAEAYMKAYREVRG